MLKRKPVLIKVYWVICGHCTLQHYFSVQAGIWASSLLGARLTYIHPSSIIYTSYPLRVVGGLSQSQLRLHEAG